jgi:DNA polymerase III gamma/tau subunit
MDPASIALIFGAAKTAFSAVQQGIKFGKDINSMCGDVAKLYGSVAKLTQASKTPPKPKLFAKVTAEEMALDTVMKRTQAAEMAEKVKNDFIAIHGVRGWEQVLKEVIRVRKQQRQLEEQKAREAKQMRDDLIQLGLVVLVAMTIMVGLFILAVVMS